MMIFMEVVLCLNRKVVGEMFARKTICLEVMMNKALYKKIETIMWLEITMDLLYLMACLAVMP